MPTITVNGKDYAYKRDAATKTLEVYEIKLFKEATLDAAIANAIIDSELQLAQQNK
ncbi:MAG: hypothetical protein Ta2A_21480 [Treponemataceae bacterium]|nr:MAG: hypothetical protein Ta2A_21480 [Treponemataceae bacterium]